MESWSAKLITQIDTKLEGVDEKHIRFFRIDEFKRNVSRVDSFSSSCPTCKENMARIEKTVENIDEAVNKLGKKRRDYDKLISRLSKHIRKEHGFYAPYYFTYIYSFFAFVAGAILGYLLMQLNPAIKLELFCLGFIIALLPIYTIGHIKDTKIRSKKRLM